MYRDSEIYTEIVKLIIQMYLDYDIKEFPIDEKLICKKFGVSLVPYSAFDREARIILNKRSKHGFFVKGTKDGPATIYYNDRFGSIGAIRFTIFHEVKHYVLNEDSGDESKDDIADFFSRFFLCPIPYLIVKGIETENEVISFCHVSMETAENVVSNIRNRKKSYGNKIFDYEVPLLEQLDPDAYEMFVKDHEDEM